MKKGDNSKKKTEVRLWPIIYIAATKFQILGNFVKKLHLFLTHLRGLRAQP